MPIETSQSASHEADDRSSTLLLSGRPLDLRSYAAVLSGRLQLDISSSADLPGRLQKSEQVVLDAVKNRESIYGVTTGFGGMADDPVPTEMASQLQDNLLNFLSAGLGDPIPGDHVRGAMLLRANVLLQGRSGIRFEWIERLVHFLQRGATPVVFEHGSIGASGDLVPLASIARAITGHHKATDVDFDGQRLSSHEVLQRLGLSPCPLQAKEGLALINGTSFSAAIAANTLVRFQKLFSISLAIQAMLLRAQLAHEQPFESFVHDCKPHPGQRWVARVLLEMMTDGAEKIEIRNQPVQDRYSVRCAPQYLGSHAEGIVRLIRMVEIEMNAVSDNPLVDVERGQLVQSGNFLGQYLGVGMDELRRLIALTAKHLDIQIAHLVAPEFNGGLPASLRGNDENRVNMGLKGLQISGNSIVPMLLQQAAPLVEHFPTYAEQFNQNINGLSWGSSCLAWKSSHLFSDYLAIATLFAIQASDLRAQQLYGNYDGRRLLGSRLVPLYEASLEVLGISPGTGLPYLFNDGDRFLEHDLAKLATAIRNSDSFSATLEPLIDSLENELEQT
ncbi:MAG: aromatic amino acid ammonia-lyase [Planctomycetota bacterium]|nr:aromatic amino acid ammonia-lyase [Planctomycetota bacterium]